jgi:hypothetical protein
MASSKVVHWRRPTPQMFGYAVHNLKSVRTR